MNRSVFLTAGGLIAAMLGAGVQAEPPPDFAGKIAINAKDSVPDWPKPPQAPAGAPNVVVILWDDIGFADTSTFGGVAETPELDRLAAQGLRYNNFYTTSMCSPTRAALLTGRNHHRVGFGIAEMASGFPGYNWDWKKDTVSVAEVLQRNGYGTAVFGKWHNTPKWEVSPAGPFQRWPTHLGFDHFYGFIGGMENHWEPSRLYQDTTAIEAPATPRHGYHLTTDITDRAIDWLHTQALLTPDKPYFVYFATGAVHGPHHAPREWIDRYRGRFDRGWDQLRAEVFARQKRLGVVPDDAKLTPRPEEVPAWASLSADQKKLYARQMEVYAGFVAHTDHEIGRLIKAVQQGPRGDNTLILHIVGDNGGAHGPPNGNTDDDSSVGQLQRLDELGSVRTPLNWHAGGWTWLGNTPFPWWKGTASHLGGLRDPLIASWPARIKDRGGVRRQFTHVNDVAGTIYEVTGIALPATVDGVKQQPLDGVSFAWTFDQPQAPSRPRTQYFEMRGNRALYQNGWMASARHIGSWEDDFTQDRWELYNLEEDFSQSRDLAARYPDKLRALKSLFESEARANNVYPLGALAHRSEPSIGGGRSEFVFYPGTPKLSETAFPYLAGRSYRITAQAEIPASGAEGIILSCGGRESGLVLYMRDGKLVFENNDLNRPRERLTSTVPVPAGNVSVSFHYTLEQAAPGQSVLVGTGSTGTGRLFINDKAVGEGKMSGAVIVFGAGPGSLGIGRGFGSPVSDAYELPFGFTGNLEKVTMQILDRG